MTEKSKIAKREEQTLAWWQENKIFEKSLAQEAPKGEFVFYDGPPFATGLPHYGHILPGTVKDIIPRYKTMLGYRVPRRWGWDCHGLPIENLVEKELGLGTKKEIEKFGIDKFNERARASVLTYEKEWKEIIPRTGRWIDMENAYKTMDASYTESVWWSFKNLFEKDLIYEGFKSMHLCPRCETTISNFEVSQGYKDITDISVYVKFELVDEPNTFLLAWTTTPWTLPGNVALAVRGDGVYVKAKKGAESFIVLKSLAEKVLKEDYEIVEEFKGETLVGGRYKTLFDYYQTDGQVYAADFVSAEEGTGIVHIAPAFGEEDYQLSLKEKLPFVQHVGTDGRFKQEVTDFAGELVKPKDDHQATDIKIIKHLAGKNLLFAKEKIIHSYPHCWRCDTPLLNYASSSWFLKVTEIKEKLIKANHEVKWVPEEIRDGRFGKWLEGARDWAISRSRYWGAPLPVWKCDSCEEKKVVGSITELKELVPKSGNKYFLMRHGEAESNVTNRISSKYPDDVNLTEGGKAEVISATKDLPSKIDFIFSSDFQRARQTAEILTRHFELNPEQVVYDKRLREIDVGDFDGKTWNDYDSYFSSNSEHLSKSLPNGENVLGVKRRAMSFLSEIEGRYEGKNILVVSHGLTLYMMWLGKDYLDQDQIITRDWKDHYTRTAEVREISLVRLPHNKEYELDLHRPHIDEVKFACQCGGEMKRVSEIFDTWYDSGSVPFASQATKELAPADFIAEGLDQTRGWFYTLLVLGVALFEKSPYKQVVVNGLVLAEDGKKMSKRLKNYPELSEVLDKYGADALRYYLIASPAVRAEDLAFSEKGLDEVVKKIILRLENVLSFYELYKSERNSGESKSDENVLDKWITSRLAELQKEVTIGLENYQLDLAARPISLFVDDLSTWYLRRSRERLQKEGMLVLGNILREFAKLLAPFMPFLAEDIYQRVGDDHTLESVHLERWTEVRDFDQKLLEEMGRARKLVWIGLQSRANIGIPVRHPLTSVTVKYLPEKLVELVKEELNVDEVILDKEMEGEIWINATLTPELIERGKLRDLVRLIQDERKKMELKPGELATLTLNPDRKMLVEKFMDELKKTCSLTEINFDSQCLTLSITPKD
ncbi:class I tRNA ligase family protein [Candidatus Nomurabacteria bacterium]|nr:class I tRNA ligase family protein [Candidatus Nomurabacteria bacterium]